ncbi:hypothetical protein AVEN_57053-1 [Araneus ventricosus]|uniref:Uncharacterized protein n=1 Tax=Araneus ventricosus TaxID=182803 RepID=A0A4Y2N9A3_ARAVE|nr:hypothetical protein AVEN_57053-1 [Araneus ventricosus]
MILSMRIISHSWSLVGLEVVSGSSSSEAWGLRTEFFRRSIVYVCLVYVKSVALENALTLLWLKVLKIARPTQLLSLSSEHSSTCA